MGDRKLIVSADDFGIGRRVTDAIIDCHVNGIVTSTTLMANMPAAEYACRRAKECPELGVGIHLNLTDGKPISEISKIPDLVDENGRFLSSVVQCRNLWWGKNLAKQVKYEFEAQIKRALDLGIQPTHFDSHQGVPKRPVARTAIIKLSKRFNIPAARTDRGFYWTAVDAPAAIKSKRIWRNLVALPHLVMRYQNHHVLRRSGLRTPDRLVAPARLIPQLQDPKKQLLACIKALPGGISELMLHPGYPDPDVADPPHFAKVRQMEAALASDPDILTAIKEQNIDLISFRDI